LTLWKVEACLKPAVGRARVLPSVLGLRRFQKDTDSTSAETGALPGAKERHMDRAGHALLFAVAMEIAVLCATICPLYALDEAASAGEGSQVDAVIAYLEERAPEQSAMPVAASTELARGDFRRGIKLFTGIISLQKGGAPCYACHTVSGIAPLGGGSLGPDLTGIYARFGATGLPPVLATLPFPTMQPIYRTRLLTSREQRDLVAFFSAVAGRTPVDCPSRMVVPAVAGFLLLFAVVGVVWRRRLRSVRRALVEEMTRQGGVDG